MTTILSGTNRKNSKTRAISEYIYSDLQAKGEQVQFLPLCEIDWPSVIDGMYDPEQHPASFRSADEDFMIGADKWIIVSPEYNGSMPGILKLFIDAISTHRYADTFAGKKALLVGVASGRAGNLRGLEHLTGYLNYLKVHVYPEKLPISSIGQVLDQQHMPDEATQLAIHNVVEGFLKNY